MDKSYKRPTARSRELRLNATDAERKLWAQLSARKVSGVRFNRQFPIGPFICDFVSRSAKLVIEVDGGQHAVDVAKDEARTIHLEAQGYRVIRFWNNDVLERIEGVVAEIERSLQAHELIKVKVQGAEREQRDALMQELCAALDAAPVQHIGNILVVWRQRREEDKPAAAAEKKPARAATAKSAAAFAAAARRAALAKASAESRRSPARSPAPRGRGTGSSSGSRGR